MTEQLPTESAQTLTDRVQARVDAARLVVDRRTTGGPKRQDARESKSLRRVFRDLGVSYRRYRSQTGAPVIPELRDAAYNFRAEPSLTSLVAVAVFLDDLDLMS